MALVQNYSRRLIKIDVLIKTEEYLNWKQTAVAKFMFISIAVGRIPTIILISQKQPLRGVLRKRRSENMQQICRSNSIEITHRHGCSSVNLLHIFRTSLPKNTSGRLLFISVITKFENDYLVHLISFTVLILPLLLMGLLPMFKHDLKCMEIMLYYALSFIWGHLVFFT